MNTMQRHLAAVCGILLAVSMPWAVASEPVAVYKTATCGCCKLWVEHLQGAGFEVTTHDMQSVSPVKQRAGVPPALASCHTAVVAGYFIEGHVPASDVQRLLAERPDIAGLAVPGMPMGSPGMEFGPPEAYDVIAVGRDGSTSVFATHGR